MIFSISKDQTTLYDEITYSGKPSSFAWVLPIKGEVEVGLSADILFATIDQLTAATVTAPRRSARRRPRLARAFPAGAAGGCAFGGSSSASAAGGFVSYDSGSYGDLDGGVTVLTQGQVGPYEMVQLKSSNGTALTRWLDKNGYRIANADAPVIAHYVGLGMDFLAIKLVPGEGVSAMQPVRVTTKGASPVLPLRLSNDLVIQASADQTELSNSYTTSRQIGQPECPIYDSNCNPEGTLPGDKADAYAAANYGNYGNGTSSSGCDGGRTTSGPLGARATVGILLGIGALGAARSRRKRTRRMR
jgi:hypothetical protein